MNLLRALGIALFALLGSEGYALECSSLPSESAPVLLDRYLESAKCARETGLRLPLLLSMERLKRKIFCSDQAEYLEGLLLVDSATRRDAEAIYDLARALQFQWELQHGEKLRADRNELTRRGAGLGFSAGVLLLGASLVLHPEQTPRAFAIFRHLLPLAGVEIGACAGDAWANFKQVRRDLPPSPAELMSLGLGSPFENGCHTDSVRELELLTTSIGLTSIAATWLAAGQWFQVLNSTLGPLKANLVFLGISILAGFLVDEGVHQIAEYADTQNLRDRFYLTQRKLKKELRRIGERRDERILDAADAFVRAAVSLQTRLNKPVLDIVREATEDGDFEIQEKLSALAEDPEFRSIPDTAAHSKDRLSQERNVERFLLRCIELLQSTELASLQGHTEALRLALQRQRGLFQ